MWYEPLFGIVQNYESGLGDPEHLIQCTLGGRFRAEWRPAYSLAGAPALTHDPRCSRSDEQLGQVVIGAIVPLIIGRVEVENVTGCRSNRSCGIDAAYRVALTIVKYHKWLEKNRSSRFAVEGAQVRVISASSVRNPVRSLQRASKKIPAFSG